MDRSGKENQPIEPNTLTSTKPVVIPRVSVPAEQRKPPENSKLQDVGEKMLENSNESDEVFVQAGEEMERKGDLPEVSLTHVTSEGVKNHQPRCYNMPPVKDLMSGCVASTVATPAMKMSQKMKKASPPEVAPTHKASSSTGELKQLNVMEMLKQLKDKNLVEQQQQVEEKVVSNKGGIEAEGSKGEEGKPGYDRENMFEMAEAEQVWPLTQCFPVSFL